MERPTLDADVLQLITAKNQVAVMKFNGDTKWSPAGINTPACPDIEGSPVALTGDGYD